MVIPQQRKQLCKEGRTAHPQQHPATGSSSLLFSKDWLAVETLLCVNIQKGQFSARFVPPKSGRLPLLCSWTAAALLSRPRFRSSVSGRGLGFQFSIHTFIFSPDEEGCVYSLEHFGTLPSLLIMAQASWPAASSYKHHLAKLTDLRFAQVKGGEHKPQLHQGKPSQ